MPTFFHFPNGNPAGISSEYDFQTRRPGSHHQRSPPQDYPPTTSSSSTSASFRGCCCCLFLHFSFLALLILVIILVIVLAVKPKKPEFDLLAIILVIVLAVKPKKPEFDLQQVAVHYVGINPTTTSSAVVSLNIRMLFSAANDNKVGMKYGESRFTVMYRGIPLGRGTIPAFFQPAHSVRRVETTISVDRVNLLQADAADLVRDASWNDRAELRVAGDVGAKIRILGFNSPEVQVSICGLQLSRQSKKADLDIEAVWI